MSRDSVDNNVTVFTAVGQYGIYTAYFLPLKGKGKGKAIPLQARCGPEGG